jgi:arsenate reductase
MFSNSFAGIAPASVPVFIGAQIVGSCVACVAVVLFFPGHDPTDDPLPSALASSPEGSAP